MTVSEARQVKQEGAAAAPAEAKLLLGFAAREGCADALVDALREVAAHLRARMPERTRIELLRRVADDPFGANTPMRAYDATLDLRLSGETGPATLVAGAAGLGAGLGDVAHADLSGALLGHDHVVVPCDPAPVRFQYWMRRRAALSHEDYLEHYVEVHADFGRKTPGIEGYVQFHADPVASRDAALRVAVGVWRVDSVSELHLASLPDFLAKVSKWKGAAGATEDEGRFVDRTNSVMFTSERVKL